MRAWIVCVGLVLSASTARAENQIEDKDILAVKPAAGVDTVQPMKPDWCNGYVPWTRSQASERLDNTVRALNQNGIYQNRGEAALLEWGYETTQEQVARIACQWPADPSVQKQVAQWRQLYLDYSGLSEREDRAELPMFIDPRNGNLQREQTAKYAKWDEDESVDAATRDLRTPLKQLLFGKEVLVRDTNVKWNALEYSIDTPLRKTSPIERAAYVWMCLNQTQGVSVEYDRVASCAPDARRVDVKAVEQEAKAWGLNALGQQRARVYALADKALLPRVEAAVMKMEKQAPQTHYKKYVLDDPERAFAGWERDVYTPHKEIYDAVLPVEAAYWKIEEFTRKHSPDKIKIGDCAAPMRALFLKYAASSKPKTKSDVLKVASDPVGGMLLDDLALCEVTAGQPMDGFGWLGLRNEAGRAPVARGPRAAIRVAMTANLLTQHKENTQHFNDVDLISPLYLEVKQLVEDAVHFPSHWQLCDGPPPGCIDPEGRVLAAKKDAEGGVVLTFKKDKIWQQEMICKPSNQIRQIFSDGTVQYEPDCHAGGWHQLVRQQDPITVSPLDAALLKVGTFARFAIAERGVEGKNGLWGFPVAVTQPSTAKGKPDKLVDYGLVPLAR